jgi:hypothetical protein
MHEPVLEPQDEEHDREHEGGVDARILGRTTLDALTHHRLIVTLEAFGAQWTYTHRTSHDSIRKIGFKKQERITVRQAPTCAMRCTAIIAQIHATRAVRLIEASTQQQRA